MHFALLWHLGRLVSWPHWAAHAWRTVLTSIGVALGVATVVGIADVSRSVLAAFESMVEAVAGEAELEVSSPVGDVSEELIEPVVGVAGVAAAAGIVEEFVPLEGNQESSIYLLGIDFLGSNLWRQQFPPAAIQIEDELAFLAQSDSVVLPETFLEQKRIKVGDLLRIVTRRGSRSLAVRGTIGDAPAAKLFGGAVALMDLPAAQAALSREGRVDRIAIDVDPDIDLAALSVELRKAIARTATQNVADALDIARPEARGHQAEQLLFSLRTTLAIMSLGALIVGAFIVYHTIAISVMQRRREFALLNASGVGQRTLIATCVIETLVLAIPGAICGVGMGKILASLASGLVAETASQIWVPLYIVKNEPSPIGTLVGFVTGLSTSVAAAYIAIRATLTAPTIETLRPAGLASDEPKGVGRPLSLGVLLVASVWLVLLVPPGVGYLPTIVAVVGSHALAYVGASLIAAPLIWLTGVAAIRWLAGRVALPVTLAAQNLPRQPGRSAGTVATITATMGIAIVVVSLVCSFEAGWLVWIEEHFGADLFIGRGKNVRLIASEPMPIELARTIAALPGVASVEPFRTIRGQVEGRPVFIQGLSIDSRLKRGGLAMVEGSLADAAPALRNGRGVLLSDNLSYKIDLHKGDQIRVPTAHGLRQFAVEGVYVDYLGSLDLGSILVAQNLLGELWDDRSANVLRVWLEPAASLRAVKEAIDATLRSSDATGSQVPYYVLDPAGFLGGVRSAVQKFFAATWALEVVAALVGVIGVVNTQLAIVMDRAAEIGVLRTIGLSRKDIIRSVVIECGALGALGGVIGVLLGLVLGAQIVLVSLKLVTGWSMAFHVPWAQLGVAILIATGVSALAGYVPARAAAGVRLGQRSTD